MALMRAVRGGGRVVAVLLAMCVGAALARADEGPVYESETLGNGLQVVYAPMPTSPVTQVRVLYHVGSKDEQPDRQGFAHMFEHMMFRGSAHVAPQEHMKMIGLVGGISNAFTSFDKTVYHDTLPNNYVQMALWLEADRMSSFKVSPKIFFTERLVVSEEWRLRQNQPYGTAFEQLLGVMFTKHHYHWAPIGNMDQLRAAKPAELQAFFNRYYVPNNAILVIAGGIDVAKTKGWVHEYFGWIPEGKAIVRVSPKEPEQTEARRLTVTKKVPLPQIYIGYPMPPIRSKDQDALSLMLSILGDGQTSRISQALVTNANPLCVQAEAMDESLEDGGVMGVVATLQNGKDPAAVEKILRAQIALMAEKPVTAEELEKVKEQGRVDLAKRFETAGSEATELGDALQMFEDLDRVKTERARMEAVTAEDIQRVAKEYMAGSKSTTLTIIPGVPADEAKAAAPAAATGPAATEAVATAAPKEVDFPKDYPTKPPLSGKMPAATFAKGVEKMIDGVRVIVMEDHRVPVVNWSLTMRQGGYAEAAGKEGLGELTAEMVRRGPTGKSFNAFNEEMESRGIRLTVSDGGDFTRISGSCLTEQAPFGLGATHDILTSPAFDADEFKRVKAQADDSLRLSLNNQEVVSTRKLSKAMYGDSPLGKASTLGSLDSITLEDVKNFYQEIYRSTDAVLMISGDITVAEGQKAAEKLVAGMTGGELPKVEFKFPAEPEKMRIILVDRPESKQSTIRIGVRAYGIESEEKFAGVLASQMLSNGIDSRLMQYVRAEKGYVYGVGGYFEPGRHGGDFISQTDTRCETTGATITAIFKVLDDMKATTVGDVELADTKFRVAGQLLMAMQTTESQAARRVEGVLNGYPVDYYDKYAERIGQATAGDVKGVMDKYVQEDHMTVVVVGPAKEVKEQLEKLGAVEEVGMPLGEGK